LPDRPSDTFKIDADYILCSVLRPFQHSIGHMGDGFYRSKDPTNSISQSTEGRSTKEKNTSNAVNIIHTEIRNSTR